MRVGERTWDLNEPHLSTHKKIQQAQLPLQHSSPWAKQAAPSAQGKCRMARGGWVGGTGHGMGGRRGGRQDGTRFNGKSAVQGFSFWSRQPLLTSSFSVSAMWLCLLGFPCPTRRPGVDVFTPTSYWLGRSICHRHCLILFPSPASHRKEMVNSSDKRIILVSSKIWLLAW